MFYCDAGQAAGDCAYRLCWNLDEGIGGARVGCTENLNNDAVRRKVMYKGNQVYSCVPGTQSQDSLYLSTYSCKCMVCRQVIG